MKIGDFHSDAAQLVHLVQVFIGYPGHIIKRKAEAELGAENVLLSPELFSDRIGLNRPPAIFTNSGIGHGLIIPEKQAFALGAGIVDRYANRSFHLRKSSKKVESPSVAPSVMYGFLRPKFRRKGKHGYIEKTAHAIDSFEEKQQIPYESIRLRKAGLLDFKKKRRRRR